MLSGGTPTAGELSDISNVPKSRSYDVLESLSQKGFVIVKNRKPLEYEAIAPWEVVERVKQKIQVDDNNKIKNLTSLKNNKLISELVLLHKQGTESLESVDITGSLQGKHNVYNHLEFMIRNASKSVLISATQDEFVEPSSRLKFIFKKLKNKNINIKIKIMTQVNDFTKKSVNEIKNFAEIKNTNNKSRFVIVDGKEMVFMVLNGSDMHPSYDVAIWVNSPLAKEFEKKYFN